MQNSLKRIRKDRGITLKALSKQSGYAVSTINNFENGRSGASPEFLRQMAETLKVSTHQVLGTEDARTNELPPRRPKFDFGTQEGSREAFHWLIENMPLEHLLERVNAILDDSVKPADQKLAMVKAMMPTIEKRIQALR